MAPESLRALTASLARFIPGERLITDPLRLIAWGTDASFYRLVPAIAVVVESEDEVRELLAVCAQHEAPITFRAAGTSLSGQAVTDSVLMLLGEGWRKCDVGADGAHITLQPGVIGAAANRSLARWQRKIGPDPASIDAAMIGGIAANNASGMCCGTAQNSYHTLAGLRVVLADGTVLDTRDEAGRNAFRAARPDVVRRIDQLATSVRGNGELASRIQHKFRLKNTTGYSLNALVDFTDPIDVIAHLMIGSEGTLGFLSEITYRTVPEYADKASALILFDDLETACRAVMQLKSTPVAAVELADRPALRSVENKPGLPEAIRTLGPEGAALLVETRAADTRTLMCQIQAIEQALSGIHTVQPVHFSTDPQECARLWNVRKGMFPSVGAMRATGTTVIIEDVAFPVPRLAEATLALQRLLVEHGYDEAIIFGHALEGNLHFVFTQDFNDAAEVARYRDFMDALCHMVVDTYDGSLKAEHGTGRNIAPFVELEWGAEACKVMRALKSILDPGNLLNPGVILNDDPEAHLANLKPLPACDEIVNKCIECGFCESRCPSHKLTLSPRQRIVGAREIARLTRGEGGASSADGLRGLYDYFGIDTCAACGLCATACPVGIETGLLIKLLRNRRHGSLARSVASFAADHFDAVTTGVRAGLKTADWLHGMLGTKAMQGSCNAMRRLSRNALPHWSPSLARAASFHPQVRDASRHADRIVYFPSCAARNMGPQRDVQGIDPLPAAAERLFTKAGFSVIYPEKLDQLCCGQPFESKGFGDIADRKSAELEAALTAASEKGALPIVFDTSPCAYRMKRYLKDRLAIFDSIELIDEAVMPRLSIERKPGAVTIHPVCSVRKMGTVDRLTRVASRCSEHVVSVDDVLCCGFAGDKGFTHPELNSHALRRLKPALPQPCRSGYSTSRTCEIGLSEHAGIPYRSIVYLVDECSRPNGMVSA